MTRLAVQTLRDAIVAWQRDDGRERVGRWRGEVDAESPLAVIKHHAWLWSPGAQEALAEAVGERQVNAESHAAIVAHISSALRRRAWLEMTAGRLNDDVVLRGRVLSQRAAWVDVVDIEDRVQRAAVASAMAQHSTDRWGRILETRAFADERVQRFAATPIDVERNAACVASADQFLKDTADAAREHVRYLTRSVVQGESPAWHDVLFALRAHALDGLMPQVTRMRRIAEPLRKLGFDRELSAHVRVEPMRTGAIARARVAVIDLPTDIRIGVPSMDWGPVSELSGIAALGRALALALTSRALPIEHRRSLHDSVPRVFSVLFAQWLSDRAFLTRVYGWSTREVETVARLMAVTLLLNARRSATLVSLDAAGWSDRDRGMDMARSAWACEVPLAWLAGWLPDTERLREHWRGQLIGLAAARTMRERFDEDWYRNPRVAEPLRGAATRGGELDADAWGRELPVNASAASDVLLSRL